MTIAGVFIDYFAIKNIAVYSILLYLLLKVCPKFSVGSLFVPLIFFTSVLLLKHCQISLGEKM